MNFMLMHDENWPTDTKPALAELVNGMQVKLPEDCYLPEFEPNSTVPIDGGFRGFAPPAAFKYMQKFGVCLDRYHPYKGRMTKRKVPARSPRIRIGGYTVLRGNADIKPILHKHPIVGDFKAYDSFDGHVDVSALVSFIISPIFSILYFRVFMYKIFFGLSFLFEGNISWTHE